MENFKIGNWLVDSKGIIWDGPRKADYDIPKSGLSLTYEGVYHWPIQIAQKTWLNREDVYTFNTAFFYALEAFEIPFPKEHLLVNTFKNQDLILKDKK
jgi:hypothetical protein